MNETDIRAVVTDVVASVLTLPAEEVSPRARFYDDLGGDSLQKLEIVAHLEARFTCSLTHEQVAVSDTVEDFTRQVAQHVS
ncbi:acyl carrier protein [Streptomyces sp. NPDC050997]|uniref:acyl carrier protein n=1 Tax=Streptomyces sp. NPDC050997 TaxID=3155519 RepID=UPI003413EF1C